MAMTPQHLLGHFKTITAIARAFRISPASVSEWISNGAIPIDRQCQAEILTHGILRADREALGPVAAPPEAQRSAPTDGAVAA